jgi:tetratricopeptide (TPR) repeat protein
MRRIVMAFVLAAAAFGVAQAQTDVRQTPFTGSGMSTDDIGVIAQLKSAEANNDSGTYEATMAMLSPIVHGEVYPRLSAAMKYRIDLVLGWAAFQLDLNAEAEQAFIRATTQFPGSDMKIWFMLLRTSELAHDFPVVYTTFKAIRRLAPKNELPLSDRSVHAVEQGFGTLANAQTAQLEFESHLDSSGWQPAYRFFSFDVIWYHFAQNLLASGNKEKAYEIAHRINDPDVLAPMLADRRFDDVRPTGNPVVAVNESAARLLETAKTIRAEDPKAIDANRVLASRLLLLGRFEEALAQINQTLANAAQLEPLDRRRYDFDSEYYDSLVLKSSILFELGRYQEALGMVSALTQGGRAPNSGMALLISRWLIDLGRGAEAITILSAMNQEILDLDAQSDLAVYRACAAAQAKNNVVLQDNIRFLREHTIYKPGALLEALLCANDINGASDAVVAALADERQRALMLERLQFYKPPKTRTPTQVLMEKRLDQVRSRPKVAEAVNRVGRINHYDIRFLGPLY